MNQVAERLEVIEVPEVAVDRRFVTGALMLVMVLASMEMTVTSTAMPTIIGDLHGLEHYSWVASIYLLACTVSMPLYGRMADAFGRKRVIAASILIFCVASMLASMSKTMGQLIVFRGLQGLGAGGVMPLVLTIIGDIFTLKERARIQGFFSAVWGSSALLGPALGAFLVNTLGWRSVFFVNLPFGLLGLMVLLWKYHEHEKPHSTDLDLPGVAALAIASMSVLLLVSRMGPEGWSIGIVVGLSALAIAAGWFFWRHERNSPNPIMPAELMRSRAIWPSMVGSALFGAGFLSLDTYVPLYVQGGRGGGAAAAASVVTPVVLTWALSGVLAAPLVVRWGFRKLSVIGVAFIVFGFAGLLICAITGAPRWILTTVLAVAGCGFSAASMSYLLSAQEAVSWQQRGMITSSVSLLRTMGGAVGIGLLGALFNQVTHERMEQLRAMGVTPAQIMEAKGSAQLSAALVTDVHALISRGSVWVFAGMVVFATLQWFVSTMLPKGKVGHGVTARDAMESMGG